MNPNNFTPIDLQTWPLAQMFYYYTQMAPTTYTVNVSMDVTILRKTLKDKEMKFFPAYLYLVTKAIEKQPELRISKQDDILGHWDFLTPAYPQFHDDDKTTSLLWTEYCNDFMTFYSNYIDDTKRYGDSHGILSAKGIPPASAYIISCIPWFTFNSFSLHNHGIKDYYVPSLEAGAFYENNGKILMPLSITVHHATTDGYSLKVFFEELQQSMDNPEEWLAL
ncbi:CatA-like O-acetyltransferase [Geosporobacter ferrireducens]|uniref:Chloramphenicol acetyltransferase CAT n=1 Tax=Geosporobacter ferrireducens TaxID=1424294 RepID=A0A1D8GK75_9FIRM|nr:CatA-like O-acetyltransferase [Geosporobacter ferrireducens]AOT71305.1 chloramphenicol acetyltransferase CAT [Geosporobacter ferrireducens]